MKYSTFYHAVQSVLLMLIISAFFLFLPIFNGEKHKNGTTSLPLLGEYAAISVQSETDALFAYINISVRSGASLPYARVLLNNTACANLSDGQLTIGVSPGDVIEIDGSAYKCMIDYDINLISSSLDAAYLSTVVSTNKDMALVGTAVFK